MKVLCVIPARYKSSRFQGKPLALINGVPMIKRTYEQVKKSTLIQEILIATDDKRIYDYCVKEDMPVAMTSSDCLTGTDRVSEISRKYDYDLYINVQGDEPVIDPASISEIISLYEKTIGEYEVYNLYKVISDIEEVESNTIIKVITNHFDEVMYMSRLPVPYSKCGKPPVFKQQVPIYGFTKAALSMFNSYDKTCNEFYEDVELLRFVDLGWKIKMKETKVDSIAVDVPEDIRKVENFLSLQQGKY